MEGWNWKEAWLLGAGLREEPDLVGKKPVEEGRMSKKVGCARRQDLR